MPRGIAQARDEKNEKSSVSKKDQYERRKFLSFSPILCVLHLHVGQSIFLPTQSEPIGKVFSVPRSSIQIFRIPTKTPEIYLKYPRLPSGCLYPKGDCHLQWKYKCILTELDRYVSLTSVCLTHAKIVRSDEQRILVTCRQGRAHFSLVAAHKYKLIRKYKRNYKCKYT